MEFSLGGNVSDKTTQQAEDFRKAFMTMHEEIGKRIVGNKEIIRKVLTSLFAGGHILLEGVPGIGKTMLCKSLAEVADFDFSRIQFTPDLMPADIVGTQMLLESADHSERSVGFQKGPVFCNALLADEINRATPKTQSALLESMQEKRVTIGGISHPLPQPFMVLATQNPLEMEGTYPLPEAQLDRFFFKIVVHFPDLDDLQRISSLTTGAVTEETSKVISAEEVVKFQQFVREVPIAPHVERYAARLVLATHPEKDLSTPEVKQYVRYGASPRAVQTLVLAGKINALLDDRFHVSCEDIRKDAVSALRHRLILNFEGEAEGVSNDGILERLISEIRELPAGSH